MSKCLDDRDLEAKSSMRPRVVMLVIGAVSIALLSPVLREVYSSLGTAVRANLLLVVLALACSALGFVSTWALQRLTLGLDRWSDVAAPQLSGNAASNLVPAGSALGLAIQLRMLRHRGIDLTRAMTSLMIAGLLSTVAGLCVFPALLVLPVGDHADLDLASATRWGLVSLAVSVPIIVALLRSDRVMRSIGNACYRSVRRLPRCHPPTDLARRIVDERDRVRGVIARNKIRTAAAALGRGVSEYLALYASLLAVGLRPSPVIVLAAFAAGNVAGMIPFTPGGLGFVEAGLGGVLVLAGAAEEQTAAAVAIYRLATTWLPVLAGVATYLVTRLSASVAVGRDEPMAPAVADVAVQPASLV